MTLTKIQIAGQLAHLREGVDALQDKIVLS